MVDAGGARRGLSRFLTLQTSMAAGVALPITLAASLWFCGGDLSRPLDGGRFLAFALALTLLEAAAITPFLSWRSRLALRSMADEREQWARLANTDPLTGLLNRRGFDKAVALLPRGGAVAALICDLDHFKRVNDLYGHDSGDAVLSSTAALLRELTDAQPGALLGRQGGEEFAVALPGASYEQALGWADDLRRRFSARRQPVADGSLSLTLSVGVSAVDRFDGALAPLMSSADAALYRAKQGGRNRVEAIHERRAQAA